MKINSQRYNLIEIATLASRVLGLREGSRSCLLAARSWGFNSPQVHQFNAAPITGDYQQGTSSGRSQKDGVSTPAVIVAQSLKEGKGQNDLPQLQDAMQKIWERPQGLPGIPLLSVLQDPQRAS